MRGVFRPMDTHRKLQLKFVCPATQARIPTGVDEGTDHRALVQHWFEAVRLRCPHCEGVHVFQFKQVYIDCLLDDLRDGDRPTLSG
jgi:hypothetical protein